LCQWPCPRSYAMVLDDVVRAFFQDVMREHGARIEQLVQAHVAHMREGHRP